MQQLNVVYCTSNLFRLQWHSDKMYTYIKSDIIIRKLDTA
jgi:hypothetical protein